MTDETSCSPRDRLAAGLTAGLVIGSGRGGAYDVQAEGEVVACRLRGRLKQDASHRLGHLAVGDEVRWRRSLDEPERGIIEAVQPRRNTLARGRPGKPPQVIAANLDQVVIVVAVLEPLLSVHTLDRFLAIAASCHVPAIVVLNKADLDPDDQIGAVVRPIYEPLGVGLLTTSTATGQGLADLDDTLAGRVSAVIGPSGTGKSSLLNALNPGYQLRTGTVMNIGKGRHTTTDSRLLALDRGGWVADTPGIKTLALIAGAVAPRELISLFPELAPLTGACRFNDCTHRTEPDCPIREAVGTTVAPSRYDSYVRLYDEIAGTATW